LHIPLLQAPFRTSSKVGKTCLLPAASKSSCFWTCIVCLQCLFVDEVNQLLVASMLVSSSVQPGFSIGFIILCGLPAPALGRIHGISYRPWIESLTPTKNHFIPPFLRGLPLPDFLARVSPPRAFFSIGPKWDKES
jgi:hypothetical protein